VGNHPEIEENIMKSRSVKMVLLAASVLASPVLTFAGWQPNHVYTPPKNEAQDRIGIVRTVDQGKGTGMSRSNVVLRGNAYRSQTANDSAAVKVNSGNPGPNWNDAGFHK
jgi:hypothetical protein